MWRRRLIPIVVAVFGVVVIVGAVVSWLRFPAWQTAGGLAGVIGVIAAVGAAVFFVFKEVIGVW